MRSQCPVAMAPVADARARVVVHHRQVRLMIGGSACCTSVITLRWRAAHLNTSTWANGNATRQSALWRRVGCGTRHRSPRGVLCVWSSTSSSSCGFWLFPGTWVGLAAARPSTIFQGFCVLCASKPEKFSGLAGADGHRTESRVVDTSKSPDRRVRASGTRPTQHTWFPKKGRCNRIAFLGWAWRTVI